jgi:hypothetical protein
VEAIKDYVTSLTQNGQLIFTVHNRWELIRLIVTTLYALKESGIDDSEAPNHFMILGCEYAPTVVIKKTPYTINEIKEIIKVARSLPADLPRITYLPYLNNSVTSEGENILLQNIKNGRSTLPEMIARNSSDISPVRDDSPFFYKVTKGVPDDFTNLLIATSLVALMSISIPFLTIKSQSKKNRKHKEMVFLPLMLFISIGLGFMILEIALFQKFILYLGSPTIALSMLLGSLLIGMGIGSFYGGKIYAQDAVKRVQRISGFTVIAGVILFGIHSVVLNELLAYGLDIRALACFALLLPFGFLLGILFPTGIQLLKETNQTKYIPLMYGVNGIMSVFGSVLSVILSMVLGFTVTFFVGISMYAVIFIFSASGVDVSKKN